MESTTLFAQTSANPAPLIAQVARDLERVARQLAVPPQVDLQQLAERTVIELWDSRVRAFVSVLALRAARDELSAAATLIAAAD